MGAEIGPVTKLIRKKTMTIKELIIELELEQNRNLPVFLLVDNGVGCGIDSRIKTVIRTNFGLFIVERGVDDEKKIN